MVSIAKAPATKYYCLLIKHLYTFIPYFFDTVCVISRQSAVTARVKNKRKESDVIENSLFVIAHVALPFTAAAATSLHERLCTRNARPSDPTLRSDPRIPKVRANHPPRLGRIARYCCKYQTSGLLGSRTACQLTQEERPCCGGYDLDWATQIRRSPGERTARRPSRKGRNRGGHRDDDYSESVGAGEGRSKRE
eukprot:1458900-Pleurochrysis_carterae.AAC.1